MIFCNFVEAPGWGGYGEDGRIAFYISPITTISTYVAFLNGSSREASTRGGSWI
jgi:hypothetical protein